MRCKIFLTLALSILLNMLWATSASARCAIISNPHDTLVCAGLRLPFTVTVSGTVSAYKWQEKTSTGWIDLVNDWYHSGVTSATMVLYEGITDNGKKFRCRVTIPCGILTSAEATLSVFPFMRLTAQPVHDTVCVGGTATFSAAGSGIGTLRYQWYKLPGYVALTDGGTFSGARSSTLTVSGVTPAMNGNKFYCVMWDTRTGASTLTATLTVNTGSMPVITGQPANRTVCSGTGSSFTVAATGTGLSYQWQVDDGSGFTDITGLPYIGQNSNTLMEAYGRPSMNGYRFRCAVTGCGTVYSNPATYTVYAAEPFALQPVNTTVCESGTTSFTASVPGALSYMWFENTGAGFHSIVNSGIYSGNGTATLTITGTPASLNGATYQCWVASGVCGTLFSDTVTLAVGCDTPIYYGPGSGRLLAITAYPNPTPGTTINVSCRDVASMDAIVRVLNRFGQVMGTNNVRFSEEGNITIDISNLLPGVYTVNITTVSITKSVTFAKQ